MRRNPCTGEWVLYVTPSKSCTKPRDYPSKSTRSRLRAHERAEHDSSCPFCPGNEHLCNGDIFALRNGAGEWTARLFENKFPILQLLYKQFRLFHCLLQLLEPFHQMMDCLLDSN